jgi:drug/metabolite transporter (DMT)-like permease
MNVENKGKAAVLAAASIWGISTIILKILYSMGYGVITLYFFSMVFVAAASLIFWKKIDFKPGWSKFKVILAITIFGNLNGLSMWFAVKYTDIALAEFLHYTMPMWAFAIAIVFLGESVGKFRIIALLLSMAGIALLFIPGIATNGFDIKNMGNMLAIASAFFYAMQTNAIRKAKSNNYTIIFWNFSISTFLIAPFYLFSSSLAPLHISNIIIMAVFAVATGFVPMLLLYYGANKIEVTKSSIILLFEAVIAVIVAWLVLGEKLGVAGIIGGLLILVSSAILIVKKK